MVVQECDALIQLAAAINRTDEVARLQTRADAMRAAMAQLWDDEAHIYTNLFANGTFYRRISPTSFYSMMAKAASDPNAEFETTWDVTDALHRQAALKLDVAHPSEL